MGSCWWGLTERLALRGLSSRAESFSGSICLISIEAVGGREVGGGHGETEGVLKLDFCGKHLKHCGRASLRPLFNI